MATGGVADDSRVCGVCLESYRGRNPKLLPCYHTFCLSCLQDLQTRATLTTSGSQRGDDDDHKGSEQKRTLTFACPTCRQDIAVPPGGVSQFQTNFYLDHEQGPQAGSLKCDLCDVGQEARYVCTECDNNLCLPCQRCHEKLIPGHTHCVQPLTSRRQLTSQDDHNNLSYEEQVSEHMMLLEAALARMGDDEAEVRRQRKAADNDISRRVDSVRALLKQAEEQSRRSLADMAETRGRKIREEMGVARRKHTHLSQLLLEDSSAAAPVMPANVQQSLLDDSELQFYQQRRDRPSVQFVCSFNEEAVDVSRLQSYVGTVYDKYEPGAADSSQNEATEARCEPVQGSPLTQSPRDARQLH